MKQIIAQLNREACWTIPAQHDTWLCCSAGAAAKRQEPRSLAPSERGEEGTAAGLAGRRTVRNEAEEGGRPSCAQARQTQRGRTVEEEAAWRAGLWRPRRSQVLPPKTENEGEEGRRLAKIRADAAREQERKSASVPGCFCYTDADTSASAHADNGFGIVRYYL